jgi:hypothetical protein
MKKTTKRVKEVKAWMIVVKYSCDYALPDVFMTKEQALRRMEMNEYYRGQHKWKVIPVKIVPLVPRKSK